MSDDSVSTVSWTKYLLPVLDGDERAVAEALIADTKALGALWFASGDSLVSCTWTVPPAAEELDELLYLLIDTLQHQYGMTEAPALPEADLDESVAFAAVPVGKWRKIIPIRARNRCLGGVLLYGDHEFGDGAADMAIKIAFDIAFRFKRQRRRLDDVSNRLDDIAQVGRILATVGEPERTLARVIELSVLASGAEVGAIVRRVKNGTVSDGTISAVGMPLELLSAIRFRDGRSLVDHALAIVDHGIWNADKLRDEIVPGSSSMVFETLLVLPLTFEAQRPGAMLLINQPARYLDDETYLASLSTIAQLAASAMTVEERHAERIEQELVKQELKAAATIQQSLLPTRIPDIPGIVISGISRPSRSVGGDFFDFFALSESKLGVMIADVSGKGIPAALLMAISRSYLRVLARKHLDSPAAALMQLNALLAGEIADNKFITANYLIIDASSGKVVTANAGHHAPIFLGETDTFATTMSGIPLGIFPDAAYEDEEVNISGATSIVLYTDGLIEVKNIAGEVFGVERLKKTIAAHVGLAPEELLDAMWRETLDYSAEGIPEDDWTSVVIRTNFHVAGSRHIA